MLKFMFSGLLGNRTAECKTRFTRSSPEGCPFDARNKDRIFPMSNEDVCITLYTRVYNVDKERMRFNIELVK